MIHLIEITAYDPSVPGEITLRYSSGRGYNDASAPGFYEPRVVETLEIRRRMVVDDLGAATLDVGSVVLANPDGGLDTLIDYGFDGRAIKVLIGDETDAYGTFATIFTGTMEKPEFGFDRVSIRVRDRLVELDVPIQDTLYLGDNALPDGLEGVADDIKGDPKPTPFGKPFNVSPWFVNTSRLIYQFQDGADADVAAVYDQAVALTQGADYTGQSDMETNAPAAGNFRVWPGGGYFRLGSSPAGEITADVVQGAADANRTAAQILSAMAQRAPTIGAGDVSSADVTALDTANSAVLGYWTEGETTIRDAMAEIARSVGAWFGFDAAGFLRMKQLVAPAGTAAATFKRLDRSVVLAADDYDIVEIETITEPGLPTWRYKVEYKRFTTVQTSDVAGSVSDARRAEIGQEWRSETDDDATVQTKHKLAPTREVQSLMIASADAAAEATRLQALHGTRRDRIRLTAQFDTALLAAIDLGSVVEVKLARFGYDGGRKFIVTSIAYDGLAPELELELWG